MLTRRWQLVLSVVAGLSALPALAQAQTRNLAVG